MLLISCLNHNFRILDKSYFKSLILILNQITYINFHILYK